MMTPSIRTFVPFLVAGALAAQQREPDAGLVALHQACLDASTDAVVLNIAAHPDDEASRTRYMLRRKHGASVVTAYATYGDGGQNAIGREIGPELAYIRVRETLAAAAMSDVGVMWLGFEDFGFSKTLEETLDVWGRDRLRDAMRQVIDTVEPDLIVTNHHIARGHGHHRACAWAIVEILKEREKSGDRVPPMFGRCGPEDAWVTTDPGELDPMRGQTYARLAHDAWVLHESQGPWGPHNPLHVGKEWWELVYPEGRERSKVDGWARWLPQPKGSVVPRFAATLPVARLREMLGEVLHEAGPKADVGRAASRALLALANVRVEVWLQRDSVPVGGEGRAYVIVHGHQHTADIEVACQGRAGQPVNAPVQTRVFELPPTPADPKAKPQPMPGKFSVTFSPATAEDGSAPAGPEPSFVDVEVAFTLRSAGVEHPIRVLERLAYTTVEPVVVKPDRAVLMIPAGKTAERTFSASIKSHRQSEPDTPIRLAMGPGIQATSAPGRLQLGKENDEARVLVTAKIEPDELTPDAGILIGHGDYSARVRVLPVDVQVPDGMRVGLIRGPDDTTERALADLGVAFDVLERDTLSTVDLNRYSALLVDIRANYHRPDLAEMRSRILEFCRSGGRVLVMYHKPREWNSSEPDKSLAPFPFTVSRERVTEENAEVKFLVPDHRLLQHPHRITSADFENWVQERGLNFPSRWDPAWTPLFEMKDSSEKEPSRGSLLYTEYGKGDYIYCSLAIYRQLRVGNPGAARLLINLLAH